MNKKRMLSEYLQACNKMHYGLTIKEMREFAYQYALKLGVTYPKEWDECKAAKRDWLLGFMK